MIDPSFTWNGATLRANVAITLVGTGPRRGKRET